MLAFSAEQDIRLLLLLLVSHDYHLSFDPESKHCCPTSRKSRESVKLHAMHTAWCINRFFAMHLRDQPVDPLVATPEGSLAVIEATEMKAIKGHQRPNQGLFHSFCRRKRLKILDFKGKTVRLFFSNFLKSVSTSLQRRRTLGEKRNHSVRSAADVDPGKTQLFYEPT